MDEISREHDRDKILAFAFGLVFVVSLLIIAVFIPNPTPFSYTIFRIVMALAAAGVGAVLPGFIEVSFKNLLRAGGAIALFVVVYFFAPVAIGNQEVEAVETLPRTNARSAAENYLELIDTGRWRIAYSTMSQMFKDRVSERDMLDLVGRYRGPLGAVEARELDTAVNLTNPPGAPRGNYQAYGFRTRFQNDLRPIYESVQLVGEGGDWRVSAHHLAVQNADGVLVPYVPRTETER
ncbi:MAG: DUF4019 domain-containing protein [Sphingomonadaceae bacterium]|nr:DUF4019 domain-containing protein [Sphingomonadaceae bacterium]